MTKGNYLTWIKSSADIGVTLPQVHLWKICNNGEPSRCAQSVLSRDFQK